VSTISVTYRDEILTKVRPVKFRALEGKTIDEAIRFVNDETDAEKREQYKEMAEYFNSDGWRMLQSAKTLVFNW
jgi:hypothetical protein